LVRFCFHFAPFSPSFDFVLIAFGFISQRFAPLCPDGAVQIKCSRNDSNLSCPFGSL
jgi:hypothetical protein